MRKNVLLINGSAHAKGSTFTILSILAEELAKNDVDSSIFQIGPKAVHGCIGCFRCRETGECVFHDDILPELVEAVKKADALVIGSPVYYAGPSGALCAVLDRLFFSAGRFLRGKPGACAVVCRRAGATAAFDRLNKYFTINRMPVVSSQYWNLVQAASPELVEKDAEGVQIMRTLGDNLALMLKSWTPPVE